MINIHGGPDVREQLALSRPQQLPPQRARRGDHLSRTSAVRSGFGRQVRADSTTASCARTPSRTSAPLLDWIAARPELDKNRVVLLRRELGRMARARGGDRLQRPNSRRHRRRGHHQLRHLPRADRSRAAGEPARWNTATSAIRRCANSCTSMSPVTRAAELKKPTFDHSPGQGSARAGRPGAGAPEGAEGEQRPMSGTWSSTDANHDNLGGVGGDYMLASWMLFIKTFVLN